MTGEEKVSQAMDRYVEMFGDGSLPGLDYIPYEYRGDVELLALLERCIREGKPMGQLIELIDYPPDVLI